VIKVGIIGTGWGSRVQVPAFRGEGFEVLAIAGADPGKTSRIASELSIPRSTADWRELVDMADIDLVTVVSPPRFHHEMALAAIKNGKHLLCEKPTALNAAEARIMYDAARAASTIAIIDHELRFLPSWIRAKETIREIGTIRHIEARYTSASRGDRTRAWNWWSDAEAGGGVWGAVGSHLVDAIRYFAGDVTAVRATLRTFVDSRDDHGVSRPVTADDFGAVELRLTSGASATIHLSVVAATDEPTSITFNGESGGFRCVRSSVLRSSKDGWVDPSESDDAIAGTREAKKILHGDSSGGAFGTGTIHLARALRRAIEGDLEAIAPAATMHDGLRQQEVLDAGRHSSSTGGGWVEV